MSAESLEPGDRVLITRPAGLYRGPKQSTETWHPAYAIADEPVTVAVVRPAGTRRHDTWIVTAQGKVYPASWCRYVDTPAEEGGEDG